LAQAVNLLLKLLGLLFVGILSILGFSGFLIWLGLKNPLVQDVLFDGAVAVAKEVLFPDGVATHKKSQAPKTEKTKNAYDTRDVQLAILFTPNNLETILKRYTNIDRDALVRLMVSPVNTSKYFVGEPCVSQNETWAFLQELDVWRCYGKDSIGLFQGFIQVIPKLKYLS